MVNFKKRLKGKLKRELKKLLRRDLCAEEVKRFMASKAIRFVSSKKVNIRGGIDFQAIEGSVFSIEERVMLNSDAASYPHAMYQKNKIRLLKEGSKLSIGERTRMHGSCITCYESVSIGKRCLIAANCQIMDAGGHRLSGDDVTKRIEKIGFDTAPVVIEDDVWLGLGVHVMPGVTIGRGSVVGAGAVVTRDIPPMVVAGGIPAVPIKEIS